MWKMLARAFFARSPRLYMSTPQATEQYGQVLRVSVARASLKTRTSARAAVGEKPSNTRLDPARVAPVTLRNSRRVTSAMAIPRDMSEDRRSLYSFENKGQGAEAVGAVAAIVRSWGHGSSRARA